MKNLTIISSLLLIALGLFGYFGGEIIGVAPYAITALIPTWVGLLMLIGGLIAIKRHALGAHISVTFAALGALAALGRLIPQALKNGFSFQGAGLLLLVMAVICVFYTIMAVRSFIAARRARK